jgi:hypothetical protein
MKRSLSLIRKLPRRDVPARRLAVLLFLGALGLLGFRFVSTQAGHPAKPATPRPGGSPTPAASFFAGLRPRLGDHMTLPRIGFRWAFDPSGKDAQNVTQASLVPSFLARPDSAASAMGEKVRYVLHLLGPGGAPEVTKESSESSLRMNLRKDFPTGECEWWVEAYVPGQPPLVSPKERFVLSP